MKISTVQCVLLFALQIIAILHACMYVINAYQCSH